MNYFEHHIGDYAAATGHLRWDEDMAYTRLLRAYYHHERAIPEGQQYRMARAATPAQRKAVDVVLAEFFHLVDGGHHQKRADEEIARFQDKQRKAKASADARWGKSSTHTERNANASPNAMRTHTERNADGMHRAPVPVSSLQSPDPIPNPIPKTKGAESGGTPPFSAPDAVTDGHTPTAAGLACRAIKGAGIADVNPGHPNLHRLLDGGVTTEELADTAAELVGKSKGKFALLLATVEGRRRDAAAAGEVPAAPVGPPWHESWHEVVQRGCALGIGPWDEVAASLGNGPSRDAYKRQVIEAWGERNGDAGQAERSRMCSACGCPNIATVDAGQGRMCSAHAWTKQQDWPRITQEQKTAEDQRQEKKA